MSNKTDIKKLDAILAKIEKYMVKLYGETYQKAVQIKQVQEAIARGETFKWMDNPAALAQFQTMLDKLARNVALITSAGIDASVNTGAGAGIMAVTKASKLTEEEQQEQKEQAASSVIEAHRDKANGGFKSLTNEDGGDRLSDRVWSLTQQSKSEMEIIIQNGIKEGKTADEVARSVQGYLVNPDKLFRRVRNKETGELELSEAAKNYHPGQGVYRSSYMNAMRLARTEVNAAYLQAETASYINNPLVVAVKIQRSNNHTTLRKGKEVELHDICDELEGTYPKDFIFTGWHPQCRCYMTPVIGKPADVRTGKVTPQEDLPPQFKTWMQANQQRLLTARTIPYFIRNNKQKIANEVDMDDTVLDILNARPEAKQSDDQGTLKQTPQDMPGDITGAQFQRAAMTDADVERIQINRRIQARMKAAELDKVKEKDIRQDMWQTFQQLKADIDKYDNAKGYLAIAHKIEEAYNILQISRDKDLAKVPSDQLSTKMPYELIKLSKHDQLPDVRIFNAMEEYVPIITNADGTYYDDIKTKIVFVSRAEERRMKASKWFDKTMPTHEYAHAIYDQRADVKAAAEQAWQLVREEIWEPGIVEKITKALYEAMSRYDYDEEKWKAITDLIQAADPEHNPISPGGHDKGYFADKGNVESEFIAHCSECFIAGNEVIKQHWPEVYKIMQDIMAEICRHKNGSARRG